MKTRCYKELSRLCTIDDRFAYLKVTGQVGQSTFGHLRYLNQRFYHSPEWIKVRDLVIVRDNGCELGVDGYDLGDLTKIYIHHMNPITIQQIVDHDPKILDPEYLICCSLDMHNAIHYGDKALLPKTSFAERYEGDTTLWR